ncbi:hypothetical protein GCM10027447_16660 [Glycomyces halotolerans]
MGREGSDREVKWPPGAWLALVGVSAGTVASFAGIGWAFMHSAGFYDDPEAGDPAAWPQESVVIEGGPGDPPGPDRDEPTSEPSERPEGGGGASVPRAEKIRTAGPDAEAGAATEAGGAPEESAETGSEERLAPSRTADPEECQSLTPPTGDEDGSHGDSKPRLVLELEIVGPLRPKG